jgi:hypothetical protein
VGHVPADAERTAATTSALATRSGWRKPSVENERHCTGVSNSHGGLTPAALVDVRSCIGKIVFSPTDVRTAIQERGALAPRGFATATAPAFVSTPTAVSRDFAEAPLQVRLPNIHGGLTPAALGWMCVCASQKSFFRRQTFAMQHKSGGR